MLGHILGILVTIGLVVLLYNELIKPLIRSWRKKEVAYMIITNKLGFAITVIVGVLVALYLFVKIITLIAESNTELHTKDTKQNDKPIKKHKPEYAKGRGDGCGQLIILIGATILLIMALIG